jgi:Protein ENHANCED DISEASE RESISTANCE 2, C-terminal
METCIDVGSNSIASAIVAMCVGYAKALTIDVGITLEGQTPDELPERLIGCLTIEVSVTRLTYHYCSLTLRHISKCVTTFTVSIGLDMLCWRVYNVVVINSYYSGC